MIIKDIDELKESCQIVDLDEGNKIGEQLIKELKNSKNGI